MIRKSAIILIATIAASSASAVTITAQDMPFAGSTPLTLEMERTGGPRGTGRSVVGDTGQPVWKTDRDAPHAYGRYGINGGPWLDSQDGERFKVTFRSEKKTTRFDSLWTDGFDQKASKENGGKSYFQIRAQGASWEIPNREKNGTGHWLRFETLKPVRKLVVRVFTRKNDGFGVAVCK